MVCWENYRCQCPNALKAGVMCVHVHAIIMHQSISVQRPPLQRRLFDVESADIEAASPDRTDANERQLLKELMQVCFDLMPDPIAISCSCVFQKCIDRIDTISSDRLVVIRENMTLVSQAFGDDFGKTPIVVAPRDVRIRTTVQRRHSAASRQSSAHLTVRFIYI